MSEVLKKEWLNTQYKRLNAIRNMSEHGLGSVSGASGTDKQTCSQIVDLVQKIKDTHKASSYLSGANDDIADTDFVIGKKMDIASKKAIEDAIINMARVCVNKTCETECNNTGSFSNVAYNNGKHSNGSNGNNAGYGYQYYLPWHSNVCGGSLRQDGKWWNGCSNNATSCSNVFYSHGANTNGCANQDYSKAIATYSTKNHYTEEEALNRLGN